MSGPGGTVATRRFDLTLANPDRSVAAIAVVDARHRLARFEIPQSGLQVVREDVASVGVRTAAARNPTDVDVSIPANGFNLAGTLTTPPNVEGRLRYPAVVLVGGTSPAGRDEDIGGVPVFAQLAGQLAASNLIVLRYDRRGAGQSGGRTDSATLSDYAEDVVAAVKWLEKRDDVDKNKIVVVGHRDAAPVALLAAAASKKVDAVVTIDGAAATGAELTLMQQQHVLDALHLTAEDRAARIELQKKIQAAVVNGSGWEGVPPAMRRQADTPWFKSVLTYDPAQVMRKVRQPLLVLHADLDETVPASEADRLADLGKARKRKVPTEVVHLPDLTGTLAASGATRVDPRAAQAIADWIKKL
jgi:dienelactone hydrolase